MANNTDKPPFDFIGLLKNGIEVFETITEAQEKLKRKTLINSQVVKEKINTILTHATPEDLVELEKLYNKIIKRKEENHGN